MRNIRNCTHKALAAAYEQSMQERKRGQVLPFPCRSRVVTSSVGFLANVATPRFVTLASDTYSVAKKAGCYILLRMLPDTKKPLTLDRLRLFGLFRMF